MKINRGWTIGVLFLIAGISACDKDPDDVPVVSYGVVQLQINHLYGGNPLVLDTVIYQNAAGNQLSVTRLQYYLSAVELLNAQGEVMHRDPGVYYVNGRDAQTHVTLKPVKTGVYAGIRFLIGMDTSTNISYSLPATAEHLEMAWPPEMGGGYHFLKLEGRYYNTENKLRGYAVHLGTQIGLVRHNAIPRSFQVTEIQGVALAMNMEVRSWLETPYSYNFNIDGNYTMGIDYLMQRVALNGKDVFYAK